MSKARDKAKKEKKARERKAKALRTRERTLDSRRETKAAETRVLKPRRADGLVPGAQPGAKTAGRVDPRGHRTQGK